MDKIHAEQSDSIHGIDDIVIQEILNNYTDLRDLSKELSNELSETEYKSVKVYMKESANISNLHSQLVECDSILSRMENMLVKFQDDIGNISTEIVTLQRKSILMSQELSNRHAVKVQLLQFVDDMAVSQHLINSIMHLAVTDDDFIQSLVVLKQKINTLKDESYENTKAYLDTKSITEQLRLKAVLKIRIYLLEQFSKFKKPMTNYQIPQNALLKYRCLYEYLLYNEKNTADEICNEYVDTMSKIYFSYFKSYEGRLMKLLYDETTTKDHLMGTEDNVTKNFFNKTFRQHKVTVFSIGTRGDVLAQQLEAPIIVPHAETNSKYPYEAIFRSANYAMVDNASREYLFITEYFIVQNTNALQLFNRIMGRTLSLLLKNVNQYLMSSHDALAIFLCFQLVLRYRLMCHKRCVPALDEYWDNLEKALLFRLEEIVRSNIDSIRDFDVTKSNAEKGPHYVCRRYAEFSSALVGISENFPNELINRLLAELKEEVDMFIFRMASVFTERKDQLTFLINNYDMILHVVLERTRDNCKEAETFTNRLNAKSTEYTDLILLIYFGDIIQYVKECESYLENDQQNALKTLENKCSGLVKSFNEYWKKSLDDLNREIMLSFPNFSRGSQLLQLALTQLVQYYHTFHKFVPASIRSQLISVHHILVEIKRYKTPY